MSNKGLNVNETNCGCNIAVDLVAEPEIAIM